MAATVLVVDDERKIRELVGDYLRREGCRVFDAASGEEALAVTRRQRPDLIVLDLGLPDVDGAELSRLLRAESAVPIVTRAWREQARPEQLPPDGKDA